jgi:hypothetical protein
MDVKTGAVPLADLLAKRAGTGGDTVIEVHYGFHRKKILRWQDLDGGQTLLISRKDGKPVPDPFWLIAVDTGGRVVMMKTVTRIIVKSQSSDH